MNVGKKIRGKKTKENEGNIQFDNNGMNIIIYGFFLLSHFKSGKRFF